MTKQLPCPPAPGPLEGYAARFDDLFPALGQRRGFREYLAGLLAPRERNKTLTALAGAEPVAGEQHPAVQRLQYFISESCWDPDAVNARRMQMLLDDPATAPHGHGVLVIDDSGDRKDGTATAHVGRQWLGRYGKTDSGIVTVTTRTSWAGPISRSAPIPRSAATRRWWPARSPSAGRPGSPARTKRRPRPARQNPPRRTAPERGGPAPGPPQPPAPRWPRALRAVRSWLTPAITLTRWWQAWSKALPPAELQALIDAVTAGHSLHLYTPP
ncbi:MAG TPA: transposase [Streptosporangiaceae bacterium]|nr:transposase [Streptosporangiaceae bacterium]